MLTLLDHVDTPGWEVRSMHVVVRRVAVHVFVELGVVGVARLLVFVDRERERFGGHRRQRIDEWGLRYRAGEQVRAGVDDRADEQPSGAAPADGELSRIRIPAVDELDRTPDEVVESVGLAEELAVLVPLPPHLAAAPDVGDRENEAAVEQA